MAESKNFNWIRNDGSTNLKTRQVKTNLHFSVEHKVYIHETFPAKTTSFWLDALMFLYQCLQRIIMLLFLLNTPRCYQFKLEQTHIFKSTCEQKYSKTEAHTSNKNYGKEQTRISIFLNTFLSLMYLQALICSVSLKYYKHFSDLGHLDLFYCIYFLSCNFAR